jgi:hypothetical protein
MEAAVATLRLHWQGCGCQPTPRPPQATTTTTPPSHQEDGENGVLSHLGPSHDGRAHPAAHKAHTEHPHRITKRQHAAAPAARRTRCPRRLQPRGISTSSVSESGAPGVLVSAGALLDVGDTACFARQLDDAAGGLLAACRQASCTQLQRAGVALLVLRMLCMRAGRCRSVCERRQTGAAWCMRACVTGSTRVHPRPSQPGVTHGRSRRGAVPAVSRCCWRAP